MGLAIMQRRRSRIWWGVFCIAFVATGAYIAFDVLDIDGSDLRGPAANGAAAAEPARTEAEGCLRLDCAPPELFGLAPYPPASAAIPLSQPSTPAPGLIVVARQGRSLARTDVRGEALPSASDPVDPA